MFGFQKFLDFSKVVLELVLHSLLIFLIQICLVLHGSIWCSHLLQFNFFIIMHLAITPTTKQQIDKCFEKTYPSR